MAPVAVQAEEFERLLPKVLRMISPQGDDDPLAQLPLGQLRLLRALSTPKSPCEVGHELGLSPSSVTQLANRLIDAGMVTKEEDAEDRRSKRLQQTDIAREYITRKQEIRIQLSSQLLQRITDESREALLATLRTLVGGYCDKEPKSVSAQLEKGFEL